MRPSRRLARFPRHCESPRGGRPKLQPRISTLGLSSGILFPALMLTHHDVTIRVRYAETDQMGVVYHSNYLIWFEVGRVELMRALGFDYQLMETEDDCHIVVAEAHC